MGQLLNIVINNYSRNQINYPKFENFKRETDQVEVNSKSKNIKEPDPNIPIIKYIYSENNSNTAKYFPRHRIC